MSKAGVIGLGDMGSGLALNLIKNGFETCGHDLSAARMDAFRDFGGHPAENAAAVGAAADVVFVMVMNGGQVREVVLGDGLISTMRAGSVVVLTATIHPHEVPDIADGLAASDILFVDSPVSGGYPGAQGGTLTMMASGSGEALDRARLAMEAVSRVIHRVGDTPGAGQTVKACLQSLIGGVFTATFEAAALAAKAGVSGQVAHDVFTTSSAGCGLVKASMENIIDRRFERTGSHISTMHKDLTISLEMARRLGVPLFTASTAMQLFEAGRARYPGGDNWVIARLMEEIAGAELHRDGGGDNDGEG